MNEMQAPNTKYCINCGTQIPKAATFCYACAAKQQAEPTPQTCESTPSAMPIASIILLGVTMLMTITSCVYNEYFGLDTLAWLSAYAGMMVSCILHRKKLYLITAICWGLLAFREGSTFMLELLQIGDPEAILEMYLEFDVYSWYYLFVPGCYVLISLGIECFKNKTGTILRIVGASVALFWEMLYLLDILPWLLESFADFTYFLQVAALSVCPMVAMLLIKPQSAK